MRLQTFHLVSIQSSKTIDYSTFKDQYMRFPWDEKEEIDIPKEIDWDEKDRIEAERMKSTISQEKLM